MPKIQTACPNCGQPIVADVTQVIDIDQEPQLKEKLLSGGLNIAQCQHCGFQGQLPVPLVYHDSEKELLLTFNPPDPNLSMEERERKMAPLLKEVTDNLPPEKRKGYLFQPQSMMSMDSLIKNVLKADGVTEEMMEDQQKKVNLLQRLLSVEGETQIEIIQQNQELIDEEFFAIFSQLAQRLIASQDEGVIQKVQDLQDHLLQETDVGQRIKRESEEIEKARASLEKLGQNLTREKLLDLVAQAPNEERVRALASLARPAMDYAFFQRFTERIENAEAEERKTLVNRRNVLLKVTKEIDQQVEARLSSAREKIDQIAEAENISESVMNNISFVDEFFVQALSSEIEKAKQEKDDQRLEKLQKIFTVIEEMSTPAEFKVIDELLEVADDEAALTEMIRQKRDQLTDEFMGNLTNILNQVEQRVQELEGEEKARQEDVLQRLEKVHSKVLKQSMESKFKGEGS